MRTSNRGSVGRAALVILVAAAMAGTSACVRQPKTSEPQVGEDTIVAKREANPLLANERLAPAVSMADSLRQGLIRPTDATITPLQTGPGGTRARLTVRFAPARPRTTIVITPEGRDVVLRDDGAGGDSVAGDGIHTAIVDLSAAELQRDQLRLQRLDTATIVRPFHGRLRLPATSINREALLDLRRAQLGRPIPFDLVPRNSPATQARSLMINDPAVVKDSSRTFDVCTRAGTKMGKWTFGYLMTEMANASATGINAAVFTRRWLNEWTVPRTVNSFTIPARPDIRPIIIDPWPKTGFIIKRLDLSEAPFRLLAIVNRVDLRQNLLYGNGGSAGEARFVFEAVDRSKGGCQPLPFTVIFEFSIHRTSCSEVRAWGQQWADLESMTPGSTAYDNALQAITEQFVRANANPAQLPNRSSISQVRTNERAIGRPWELREFVLDASGFLLSTNVKNEPDMSFLNSVALAGWVNANTSPGSVTPPSVPLLLPGTAAPFRGARSFIPNDNTSHIWDNGVAIATDSAREQLSLNTCSGCHTGETTTEFTHVKPQQGIPAPLSGFLTGVSVPDPDQTDGITRIWEYGDLDRRGQDLDGLVNSMCLRQLVFNNISRMVH